MQIAWCNTIQRWLGRTRPTMLWFLWHTCCLLCELNQVVFWSHCIGSIHPSLWQTKPHLLNLLCELCEPGCSAAFEPTGSTHPKPNQRKLCHTKKHWRKVRWFDKNPFNQFLQAKQTIHPSLSQAKGSYVIPSQTKKTLEKSEMVRTWFDKNPPNQSKSISASYAKANNTKYRVKLWSQS